MEIANWECVSWISRPVAGQCTLRAQSEYLEFHDAVKTWETLDYFCVVLLVFQDQIPKHWTRQVVGDRNRRSWGTEALDLELWNLISIEVRGKRNSIVNCCTASAHITCLGIICLSLHFRLLFHYVYRKGSSALNVCQLELFNVVCQSRQTQLTLYRCVAMCC